MTNKARFLLLCLCICVAWPAWGANNLWYFVVDKSKSIRDSKLEKPIQDAIFQTVNLRGEDDEIRIIFFSTRAGRRKIFPSMTLEAKTEFMAHFKKQFKTGGSTLLYDTVARVIKEVNREAGRYAVVNVLILSDGEDSKRGVNRDWRTVDKMAGQLKKDNEDTLLLWYTLGFNPSVRPSNIAVRVVAEPTKEKIRVEPAPIASFEVGRSRILVGEKVFFNWKPAAGGKVDSCTWLFGDGTKQTLTGDDLDCHHAYNRTGVYDVTLSVRGPGGEDSKTMKAVVEVMDVIPLTADFSWAPLRPRVGEQVFFINRSSGGATAYQWSVSGRLSTDVAPSFKFSAHGNVSVTLTASTALGKKDSRTKTLVVRPPLPDPSFDCKPDSVYRPGSGGIKLAAKSRGPGITHTWKCSDGTTTQGVDRTVEPKVVGEMLEICHEIVALGEINIAEHRVYIEPPPIPNPPNPGFAVEPKSIVLGVPRDAAFRCKADETEAGCTHVWTVPGVGVRGTGPSFVWQPTEPGNYTICHQITCDKRTASTCSPVKVTMAEFSADFTMDPSGTIHVTDDAFVSLAAADKNPAVVHAWSADGGSFDDATAPATKWRPDREGTFSIKHTVVLAGVAKSASQPIRGGVPEIPIVKFEPVKITVNVGEEIEFIDKSEGRIVAYAWDFGDGLSSTEKNPKHTYYASGVCTVSLEVTSALREKVKGLETCEVTVKAGFPYWVVPCIIALAIIVAGIIVYLKLCPPLHGTVSWQRTVQGAAQPAEGEASGPETQSGEFELSGRRSFDLVKAVNEELEGQGVDPWEPEKKNVRIVRKADKRYRLYVGGIEDRELDLPDSEFSHEDVAFKYHNEFDEPPGAEEDEVGVEEDEEA